MRQTPPMTFSFLLLSFFFDIATLDLETLEITEMFIIILFEKVFCLRDLYKKIMFIVI